MFPRLVKTRGLCIKLDLSLICFLGMLSILACAILMSPVALSHIVELGFTVGTRRCVQGVHVGSWLRIALLEAHWDRVKHEVEPWLISLNVSPMEMWLGTTTIDSSTNHRRAQKTEWEGDFKSPTYSYEETAKSALTIASEKAIESYFPISHLLFCVACENFPITTYANTLLLDFELRK